MTGLFLMHLVTGALGKQLRARRDDAETTSRTLQ
jgi:hypothetical protein